MALHRYQLEAFVDLLRGREPVWWIDNGDSCVANENDLQEKWDAYSTD
jgi:hypothetical protein